jgi:DNA mismatch repair protein MutS
VHRPLRDRATLMARYQAVDTMLIGQLTADLQAQLEGIGDVERILARIALRSARPRDLRQLQVSLSRLPALRRTLAAQDSPLLRTLHDQVQEHTSEHALLASALVDSPPMLIRDGGVIASGYDTELDDLRGIADNADRYLLDMEQREKARTGISTLKLGYNRVHGYYIEMSKGQSERAPADYVRRQTLKSAERYITPELKAFEDKVLSARERSLAREKYLYEQLIDKLLGHLSELQATAGALAELDVLVCFADRAVTRGGVGAPPDEPLAQRAPQPQPAPMLIDDDLR